MLSLCVMFFLFIFLISSQKNEIISPIPMKQKTNIRFFSKLLSREKEKTPEELKKIITESVGNSWNNYSVLIQDLNSDFTVDINSTVIYNAASVIKVPVVASLYFNAQVGELDLDKTITLQKSDIQDYGTGSMRYDPPGTTYSLKTLARLLIQKSDNTAGYILANQVMGLTKIQELIESWGLTQTDMEDVKTSNKDMAILMSKIYEGGITNYAFTQEMLAFFKNTDFEDRIPALLPKETTVYHKIGNEVNVAHDIGIVVSPATTYYIGFLTSDIQDFEETKKLQAELSKKVYDYFNSGS